MSAIEFAICAFAVGVVGIGLFIWGFAWARRSTMQNLRDSRDMFQRAYDSMQADRDRVAQEKWRLETELEHLREESARLGDTADPA